MWCWFRPSLGLGHQLCAVGQTKTQQIIGVGRGEARHGCIKLNDCVLLDEAFVPHYGSVFS